jgi:excisionase family DNA binding protein
MEKLCIVRRRKSEVKIGSDTSGSLYAQAMNGLRPSEITAENRLSPERRSPPRIGFKVPDDQKLSIELTAAQADVVRSHAYFSHSSGAEAQESNQGSGFGAYFPEEGKIVFNFYFRQISLPDLLTGSDVCHLLHVSRTFLARLVRDGKLKSYKIGRLRRFSLEGIRALLDGSSEVLLKGEDHVL